MMHTFATLHVPSNDSFHNDSVLSTPFVNPSSYLDITVGFHRDAFRVEIALP